MTGCASTGEDDPPSKSLCLASYDHLIIVVAGYLLWPFLVAGFEMFQHVPCFQPYVGDDGFSLTSIFLGRAIMPVVTMAKLSLSTAAHYNGSSTTILNQY